jgi:membrane-bound lytic murein transglycosylase A
MRAVPYILAGVLGAMAAADPASSDVLGFDQIEDRAPDGRADNFYGTGAEAGWAAGQIKDGGRIVVLVPIKRACAMLSDP